MKLFLELCHLQSETVGANFTLSYSTERKVHIIHFPNKKKRFEHQDIYMALKEAITWINDNRKQTIKFKL